MNITPQVSWLTESFTNWCAHLCGLGGDHTLLSMSLTFTLFWCCFSIHIVTHCGCEWGGHCAVKYGEDFLQKSNKRIVDLLYHLFPVLCWATWYLHQVDYVKLDGCHSDPATMEVSRDQPYKNILWWNMVGEIWSWSWFLVIDRQAGYAEFGAALRATGRPIVYQCEWPLYQVRQQVKVSNIPEQ